MLISTNNVETIKSKITDLRIALSEISVAAYQSAAAATASSNSAIWLLLHQIMQE